MNNVHNIFNKKILLKSLQSHNAANRHYLLTFLSRQFITTNPPTDLNQMYVTVYHSTTQDMVTVIFE